MYCNKCKNEISENVKFCPHCGSKVEKENVGTTTEEVISDINSPNEYNKPSTTNDVRNDNNKIEKRKKRRSITNLVIGIVSMVMSLLILFQSCMAGVYNTMSNTGDLGGTAGFLVFAIMLAAGIVSVVTRKSEKKGTGIIIAIMYFISAFFAITNSAIFTDLKIWGWVCIFFGGYFLEDVLFAGKNNNSEDEPIIDLKCNKCGTTVGLNDKVCPNCGAKITNITKTISIFKTIGSIIVGLLIVSLIIYSISSSIGEKKDIKESTSLSPSDAKVAFRDYDDNENYIKDVGTVDNLLSSDYYEYDGTVIKITGDFDMDRTGDMYLYSNNGRIFLQGINETDLWKIIESESYNLDITGEFKIDNEVLYIDTYTIEIN